MDLMELPVGENGLGDQSPDVESDADPRRDDLDPHGADVGVESLQSRIGPEMFMKIVLKYEQRFPLYVLMIFYLLVPVCQSHHDV